MNIYFNKKKTFGISIDISRERLALLTRRWIALLSAVAVLLGVACLAVTLRYRHVRVEAGEEISAAEIARDEGAYFGADFDPDCVNHAGVWFFDVVSGEKTLRVRLKVRDTQAPLVTVKDIRCAVGGDYPKALDFLDAVYEPDGLEGEFVTPLPEIKSMGTYEAQVRYRDASGNRTEVFDVRVTVAVDREPPKIVTESEVVIAVGESLALDVRLEDDCAGRLTYRIDDGGADLSVEGTYTVYVIAADAIGNESAPFAVTVRVVAPSFGEEE